MTAPPPPYGSRPASPPRPLAWQSPGVIMAVVAVVVVVIAVMIALGALASAPAGFPSFIFLPFCGVFVTILVVIVLVVVLAATQGFSQQRIPPPPPIQQPMVPAGAQGPIALNCPNCGAPPQNVDRFGVATCTYCNTRFLVR